MEGMKLRTTSYSFELEHSKEHYRLGFKQPHIDVCLVLALPLSPLILQLNFARNRKT